MIGVLLLLVGCAGTGGRTAGSGASAPAATAAAAEAPADPIVAFVAQATPGAAERITIGSTGESVPVRLTRTYFAASGRECRQVAVGTGLQERTNLYCWDGARWTEARPLLRGGATSLP